jgi:hypothetical protein
MADHSSTDDKAKAALGVARLGFAVLPLHTPTQAGCSCAKSCGNVGKHPRTAHGLKDATIDERTISIWWAQWPDANIGIRTGPESGLLVIDIDGDDFDLPEALRNLPRTLTVKTARGRHIYFRYPAGASIGNRTKIGGLKIDLRGTGGYVVGDSSLHSSGHRYEWEIGPEDCELAEIPSAALAWLNQAKAPPRSNSQAGPQEPRRTETSDVMRRARAYVKKIPAAVQGCNGSGQLMAALRQIYDRFELDPDEFKQIAAEYSDTCRPPWSERELAHAIENIRKEASKQLWLSDQHRQHNGVPHSPPPADGPTQDNTIVNVIRKYLEDKYDPTFRRGTAIWSNKLAREINRSEACTAPTSDIIPLLLNASNFPRDKHGVKDETIPSVYRNWAPIAWADLIAALDDEPDSPEISETAGQQFRDAIAKLMNTLWVIPVPREKGERPVMESRTLIDWCQRFAKPGRWQHVRSLRLWCRLVNNQIEVAFHCLLFGQVRQGSLAPPNHGELGHLAEMYGVGFRGGHTSRSRFVELSPEFIAELLAGPCDGRCDDDGDAASRTRTRTASHSASHSAPEVESSRQQQ